ncbi:MAG TPA: SRPBCC domain-containing protein [Kofleriaceae bacterium]
MPAAESANDLIDDREYAVPRELVFEAWTVPQHFARWFAPYGVDVPFCEIDARPGGEIRFHHRSTTGEIVSIKGVFDEVVAPARLQFTFTFVDADDRPTTPPRMPDWPVGVHIVMTVELHATPRGTRMTVRQHVAESEAAGTPAVVRHGELAREGWRQTAERLVAYLEQRSKTWPS